MPRVSIHKRLAEKVELAETYAADGAFHTASTLLHEAGDIAKRHADKCDRELAKMLESA